MGDANSNHLNSQANILDAFRRSGKRPRNQLEDEITPTQSMHDSCIETPSDVSKSNSEISLPQLQLNDDRLPSVDTVIETMQVDKDKVKLAFKVDNLKDKLSRYESHVTFLRKCLDNNVTPNGLRVYE